MNTAIITASLSQDGNNFRLIPATAADRRNVELVINGLEGKYLSVTLKNARNSKTRTQMKTAWALISAIFESMYFRKPNKRESEQFYKELLDEFADRTESLLHENETVPCSFSQMTSSQMSRFIQNLINLLSDCCDLNEEAQSDVKILFTEWQNYMSSLDTDPRDFDDEGNMLPIEEWRKKNSVSFASGIGGPLELAHIVSRGADEIHRDCCWNTMMLTHEEHMLQHQIGWTEFLKIYPHLLGRVNRARKIAHKIQILEE